MSDTLTVFPRNLLKEFITQYKKQPCLWDKNCMSYKIKNKRHAAITKLTKLVQEYDSTATRVHVLRKIESLRACVRREYKKVQDSKKLATNEDEIYTPHLWYYELFSFIFQADEMNATVKSRSSPVPSIVDSEPEEESVTEDERPFEPTMDNYNSYNVSGNPLDMQDSGAKRYYEEEKPKRHCTEIEDEYDAIGINVAAKLRNLPESTRILAEKLINDILYQAQTNGLTTSTAITTPDPFKESMN